MTSPELSPYDIEQQIAELNFFTTLGEAADKYYTKLGSENPTLGESAETYAAKFAEVVSEADEAYAHHITLLKRGFMGIFLITGRYSKESEEFEFPTPETLVNTLQYLQLNFDDDIGRTAHEFSLFALMAQTIKDDEEYLFDMPDARLGFLFSVIGQRGFARGMLGLESAREA